MRRQNGVRQGLIEFEPKGQASQPQFTRTGAMITHGRTWTHRTPEPLHLHQHLQRSRQPWLFMVLQLLWTRSKKERFHWLTSVLPVVVEWGSPNFARAGAGDPRPWDPGMANGSSTSSTDPCIEKRGSWSSPKFPCKPRSKFPC